MHIVELLRDTMTNNKKHTMVNIDEYHQAVHVHVHVVCWLARNTASYRTKNQAACTKQALSTKHCALSTHEAWWGSADVCAWCCVPPMSWCRAVPCTCSLLYVHVWCVANQQHVPVPYAFIRSELTEMKEMCFDVWTQKEVSLHGQHERPHGMQQSGHGGRRMDGWIGHATTTTLHRHRHNEVHFASSSSSFGPLQSLTPTYNSH